LTAKRKPSRKLSASWKVVTRQQLYASVRALANLADRAGSAKLSVEATHPEGLDPG
jgi:sugar phosphate isomerase/epimerase